MKFITMAIVLSLSAPSFAISTEKLIRACKPVGTEKITRQARALGLEVDPLKVRECGVDNRPLNIASYVWFCASSKGGEKDFKVLTQKPRFRPCF